MPASPLYRRDGSRRTAFYPLPTTHYPLMTTPLTIVIFGGTGDLTARKLAPSLYRLDRKGRLPAEARIVASGRGAMSDDAYRDKIAAALREFAKADWDEAAWRKFAPRLAYAGGDAAKPGGLENLKVLL